VGSAETAGLRILHKGGGQGFPQLINRFSTAFQQFSAKSGKTVTADAKIRNPAVLKGAIAKLARVAGDKIGYA